MPEGEWERTLAALEANNWNQSAAARQLGKSVQTINSRLLSARARKLIPESTPLDGYRVRETSTLYDRDGAASLTWVKTDIDKERQEIILRETISAMMADITPAKRTPAPKTCASDLCSSYLIGDAHMGLYSWGDETGDDFDTTIAKRDLMGAADRLVASAPASDEAIVVQLGDFSTRTRRPTRRHAANNRLDVDTRFAQVIRAGIQTMRYFIDAAKRKHRTVRVRNCAGNHDPHACITLTEALRGYYIDEPRVIIEDSPKPFWTFRHGDCLVGITHGHTMKPEKMAGVLAVEAREDWGLVRLPLCVARAPAQQGLDRRHGNAR